jgi:hypothetical protein
MCVKDNALFAFIRSVTTIKKTKRAKIVRELVNLDHALGEMISYEVLRVRARQETTTRDHR